MRRFTVEEINLWFPIEAILVYPGGMQIQRSCNLPFSWSRNYSHKRGRITLVNKRSLNKLALLVKSCGVSFESVMTLTYGQNYPLSGRTSKIHLNKFLTYAKRAFGNFDYVWVLEFQERGAVHFHLVTTLPPPTESQRYDFAVIWRSISVPGPWEYCRIEDKPEDGYEATITNCDTACFVVHKHPKAWDSIRKHEGVGRYFAKYANKLRQKNVPQWYGDVGRFWGASRGVKMPEGVLIPQTRNQALEVAEMMGRRLENWPILPKIVLF